jgi:hypothetical protein
LRIRNCEVILNVEEVKLPTNICVSNISLGLAKFGIYNNTSNIMSIRSTSSWISIGMPMHKTHAKLYYEKKNSWSE